MKQIFGEFDFNTLKLLDALWTYFIHLLQNQTKWNESKYHVIEFGCNKFFLTYHKSKKYSFIERAAILYKNVNIGSCNARVNSISRFATYFIALQCSTVRHNYFDRIYMKIRLCCFSLFSKLCVHLILSQCDKKNRKFGIHLRKNFGLKKYNLFKVC